jgi:methyl-accepting chemotaxis protein
MSLKKKIFLSFFIMILMILAVGIVSLHHSNVLMEKMDYMASIVCSRVLQVDQFKSALLTMRLSVEKYIYRNKEEDNQAAEAAIAKVETILKNFPRQITDPGELGQVKAIQKLTQDYIEKYRNVVIRYAAIGQTQRSLSGLGRDIQEELEKTPGVSQDLMKKFMLILLTAESYMRDYDPVHFEKASVLVEEMVDAAGETVEKDLITSIEDYRDNFEGLVLVTQKMEEEVKETLLPLAPEITRRAEMIYRSGLDSMGRAHAEVGEKVSSTRKWVKGMILFALAAGIFISIISANRIIGPVSKVIAEVMTVARGDLRPREIAIQAEDELGQLVRSVNTMIMKLGDMVRESINISHQLAESTSRHASSVEETSSSLEEMASMVQQNADSAGRTKELMNSARQIVERAETFMAELIRAMEKITQASEQSANVIKHIDNIAFQTNLLALNAAIEAARAGEAGAGFAVVAEEVRSLAIRSAQAARTTSDLIQTAISSVTEGAALTQNTRAVFSEVASNFTRMTDLITEISRASLEQAQGIDQINQAVGDIDRVSQQNVIISEKLRGIMDAFKI